MEKPESFKGNTNKERSLAYTDDFKEWIKNHPGIISAFKKLSLGLSNVSTEELKGRVFKEEQFTATIIRAYPWGDRNYIDFKLEIGDDTFFVKSEGVPHRGKGYDELKNSQTAREKLKDIEWLEVIDYQLGYQDKNGRSYFVSKWLDLPLLKDYLDEIQLKNLEDPEYLELKEKIKQIQQTLPDFHDINSANMFYNPASGKIIIFDLFTESQSLYKDENLKDMTEF